MKKRKLKKGALIFLILLIPLTLISLLVGGYFLVKSDLPQKIVLNVGEKFKNEYMVSTSIGNIYLNSTKDAVDMAKIGEYDVDYEYKYLLFNFHQDIKVEVVDEEPPEFVSFADKVEVYLNDSYDEKEYPYEVKDNYDDGEKIVIDSRGSVDTSKTGEYYIVYTATDTSGNKTEAVRKVVVERPSPLSLSLQDFNLKSYFPDTILKDTGDMGDDYMNKIIFAGDSVYWNFARFNIYDKSKVWAKPCTNPDNIYNQKVEVNGKQTSSSIPELIEEKKPEIVVLNIGGCQTQYSPVDEFIEQYKSFLKDMQEKQKQTKFIVQTFNPVVDQKGVSYLSNAERNKFNYYVTKMCQELGIPVLDAAEALKDSTGRCTFQMCMSDGYHPNKKGMRTIVDYTRTHGLKLEEKKNEEN